MTFQTISERAVTAALFLLMYCTAASAWGNMGHQTIVAIAENHLTPKAKAEIAKYIPYDLVEDARWMDQHRTDPELLYAYHFHEQCINLKTLEYDPNAQVEKGDMMRALRLADYNLSHRDQMSDSVVVLSIRMLIHFMGDLHCPVHLGIPSCWFPKPPYRQDLNKWYYEGKAYKSFHAFIDKSPDLIFKGMDEWQAAAKIDHLSKAQARRIVKGDFVDWTNDAARNGWRIYEKQPPIWEIPDTPEAKYIPEGYLDFIEPIVTEELLKGGYQLAYLLNRYFNE